ncbi:MAG: PEP-CTERM sorting domain-containing protein [Methylomicrobium sp.]|nr:PEP-CTERM sorting domain-containing protein [Methylomicrobium sp.]
MKKALTSCSRIEQSKSGKHCALGLSLAALLFAGNVAQAALIETTLGNNNPGFAAGSSTSFSQVSSAQSGQPAPFDQGYGNDLLSNFNQSWTFNFAAINDPIQSAQIAFGIVDTDSGSPGDQIDFFSVDGVDLTASLNSLFEASASATGVYDVFTLSLNSIFSNLTDGSVTVALGLKGPVVNRGIPGVTQDQTVNFNGAALIYSTLSIQTQTTNNNVPEPSVLLLMMSGLLSVFGFKARNARFS